MTTLNLGKQLLEDVSSLAKVSKPVASPLRATAANLLAMGNTPVAPKFTQEQFNTAIGNWYDRPDFLNKLNEGSIRYLGLSNTGSLNIPKGFFSDQASYDTYLNKVGGLKQAVQNAWDTGLNTFKANRGPITNIGDPGYRSDASWLENATPAGTAAILYQPPRYQSYMGYYQAQPALTALQNAVYSAYGKGVGDLYGNQVKNMNLANNYIRDVTQGGDLSRWNEFRKY